jgi:hypothetical protein
MSVCSEDPIKYDYTTNKLTTQARYCVWDSTVNNCVCEVVYHDSSKAKLVYAVTQTPQHSNVSFSNFSNHSDKVHSDVAFSNFSNHSNVAHSDVASSTFYNHSDVQPFFDGIEFSNVFSDFTNHSDRAHSNTAFSNFSNHSDKAHSDVAFSNFSNHSNVAHTDSGYCPSYTNAANYDSTKKKLVYTSLSGTCYAS